MSEDQILEQSPAEMLAKVSNSSIALWSDDKKKEFVDLFDRRSRTAQYLLKKTALIIIEKAHYKHFIGIRVYGELSEKASAVGLHDRRANHYDPKSIGGRSMDELDTIAGERAKLILDELPPITKAVEIIDPVTAKLMKEQEKLIQTLKELRSELNLLPTTVSMREVDSTMSIGAFLEHIEAIEDKRAKVVQKMQKVGAKGQELDNVINKKLYNGLPGLSEAVVNVVTQYLDRSTGLNAVTRRVEEKVKFGDDAGAVELLKGFEKDEVTISDSVKAEFSAALEKLNLLGAKSKKALAGPKKGKK